MVKNKIIKKSSPSGNFFFFFFKEFIYSSSGFHKREALTLHWEMKLERIFQNKPGQSMRVILGILDRKLGPCLVRTVLCPLLSLGLVDLGTRRISLRNILRPLPSHEGFSRRLHLKTYGQRTKIQANGSSDP